MEQREAKNKQFSFNGYEDDGMTKAKPIQTKMQTNSDKPRRDSLEKVAFNLRLCSAHGNSTSNFSWIALHLTGCEIDIYTELNVLTFRL